jgi:hypothetical protein
MVAQRLISQKTFRKSLELIGQYVAVDPERYSRCELFIRDQALVHVYFQNGTCAGFVFRCQILRLSEMLCFAEIHVCFVAPGTQVGA